MIDVPAKFRPHINVAYPQSNVIPFEEWYGMQNLRETPREYLGVYWTSYYVNNKYGEDKRALDELQEFLDSLDPSKKYYTICQYDNVILNDIFLDIKIFGMSRRVKEQRIDEVIPLLPYPSPHKFSFGEKPYFASFVGNITHPVRKDLVDTIQHLKGYYCSTAWHDPYKYHEILAQSRFCLAPRGYGSSSFRAYEAIQRSVVPVYITDDVLAPYDIDFNEYGVVISNEDVFMVDEILRSISSTEYVIKLERMWELYRDHFTFEGCAYQIMKKMLTE